MATIPILLPTRFIKKKPVRGITIPIATINAPLFVFVIVVR